MKSLSTQVEKDTIGILLNLAKQENNQGQNGKYKMMYRVSLLHQSSKAKSEKLDLPNIESLPAYELLTKLRECLDSSMKI